MGSPGRGLGEPSVHRSEEEMALGDLSSGPAGDVAGLVLLCLCPREGGQGEGCRVLGSWGTPVSWYPGRAASTTEFEKTGVVFRGDESASGYRPGSHSNDQGAPQRGSRASPEVDPDRLDLLPSSCP